MAEVFEARPSLNWARRGVSEERCRKSFLISDLKFLAPFLTATFPLFTDRCAKKVPLFPGFFWARKCYFQGVSCRFSGISSFIRSSNFLCAEINTSSECS
jgi:hypothetical protein